MPGNEYQVTSHPRRSFVKLNSKTRTQPCPLCKFPNATASSDDDKYYYRCLNHGDFGVSGTALAQIKNDHKNDQSAIDRISEEVTKKQRTTKFSEIPFVLAFFQTRPRVDEVTTTTTATRV